MTREEIHTEIVKRVQAKRPALDEDAAHRIAKHLLDDDEKRAWKLTDIGTADLLDTMLFGAIHTHENTHADLWRNTPTVAEIVAHELAKEGAALNPARKLALFAEVDKLTPDQRFDRYAKEFSPTTGDTKSVPSGTESDKETKTMDITKADRRQQNELIEQHFDVKVDQLTIPKRRAFIEEIAKRQRGDALAAADAKRRDDIEARIASGASVTPHERMVLALGSGSAPASAPPAVQPLPASIPKRDSGRTLRAAFAK